MSFDIVDSVINQGITLVLESFVETNTEFTTKFVAEQLNKMKWAGKDDWTSEYIEMYLDNLRGNASAQAIGNIMSLRLTFIQAPGVIAVFNSEKIFNTFKRGLSSLRRR